jgi:formate dehydrogenase subunit gamma
MQWIPEYKEDVKRVERFNFVARITHWGHTVTFLLCLFTGLVLFLDGVDWLAAIFGGYGGVLLGHRIAGVLLTILIGVFVVFDFKGIISWIKDILRFGMNDIRFILNFPLEFMGFRSRYHRKPDLMVVKRATPSSFPRV